jgi:uncharacterized protein YegL
MDQSGLRVLPIYLVIDVSASMANGADLDAAGAIVPAVADALARNPALAGCIRLELSISPVRQCPAPAR